MSIQAKICGVKTVEAVKAACDNGAHFLGFNFYPKSPRYIEPAAAAELAAHVTNGVKKVALFVDAKDHEIDEVLKVFPADIIQLHGHESPDRAEAIKQKYGKPIIKAFGIGEPDDLEEVTAYEDVADWFLFDARPPDTFDSPGGNAIPFNWAVMKRARVMKPWFLAGGLRAENIRTAVEQSGTYMVDVASGVEKERGQKDPALIAAFLKAVTAI
jgi:phosphoribosylanthranilate isomerase